MLIYWLLLAFPAVMAMAFPIGPQADKRSFGQLVGLAAFVLFFTALGGLRFEVGGDWETYLEIYESIRLDRLGFAFFTTDPLYGLLNWISAQVGGEIYLVNAVCCLILGYGTVRAAFTLREPWLAITIAVPYLLIVVGLGYVRQGTAIGLILMAIASFDNAKPVRTMTYLVCSALFHSSAVVVFPVFAWALFRRSRIIGAITTGVVVVLFLVLFAPRLGTFEAGYIDAEYESEGALPRLLMGALPAAFVLLRFRQLRGIGKSAAIWMPISIANILALIALFASPSSTAVDRIGLYFSIIQLFAYGEIRSLLGSGARGTLLVRLVLIGGAVAVQSVWLIYATHSVFWVPYHSLFDPG